MRVKPPIVKATAISESDGEAVFYAWPAFGNTLAELKELATASDRRIRYLDQEAEIGSGAEYGIVVLERRR